MLSKIEILDCTDETLIHLHLLAEKWICRSYLHFKGEMK